MFFDIDITKAIHIKSYVNMYNKDYDLYNTDVHFFYLDNKCIYITINPYEYGYPKNNKIVLYVYGLNRQKTGFGKNVINLHLNEDDIKYVSDIIKYCDDVKNNSNNKNVIRNEEFNVLSKMFNNILHIDCMNIMNRLKRNEKIKTILNGK